MIISDTNLQYGDMDWKHWKQWWIWERSISSAMKLL